MFMVGDKSRQSIINKQGKQAKVKTRECKEPGLEKQRLDLKIQICMMRLQTNVYIDKLIDKTKKQGQDKGRHRTRTKTKASMSRRNYGRKGKSRQRKQIY